MRRLSKNNQDGFSLVEAVMASGMVAIVALVSISIGRLSTNSNTQISNDKEIEALTTEIKSLLENPVTCALNLGDPGRDAAVGFNVGDIENQAGETRFIESGKYNFIQLNSLDVEPPSITNSSFVSSPGIGFVNLVATWLPLKNASTARLETSKIKLWVQTNGDGRVINCSSITKSENNLWRRSYSDAKNLIYLDGAVSIGTESAEAPLVVQGKLRASLPPMGQGMELDPGNASRYSLNILEDQKIVFSNLVTTAGIDTQARDVNLTGELIPTPSAALACNASTVGLMRVNTTHSVLQYCGGDDIKWIDLDEM